VTTAKTYRRPSRHAVRTAKTLSAREALGTLTHGQDVFILTYGQFSLIDLLVAILDQTGPADVTISTWTAADAHLQRSRELLESSQIRTMRWIVDQSFETRQPEYCYHMRQLFGADCIRAIRTHAKFMIIRNDQWDVVVRTSMNMNENPRLENAEVAEDSEFAAFFSRVADTVFAEDMTIGARWAPPLLGGVPEDSPFQEVEAAAIKREAVNEADVTHRITKNGVAEPVTG